MSGHEPTPLGIDDACGELVEIRCYLERIADSLERLVELREMAEREPELLD